MPPAKRKLIGLAGSLVFFALTSVGEVPETNSIGMRLIGIRAGTFFMGASADTLPSRFETPAYLLRGDWDERPVHAVTLTRGFAMSETEVTVEQFRQFHPNFVGNPSTAPYVSGVSWDEAMAFCDWLSKKEGRTYRLPTEAEWEYVARAGSTTLFAGGDEPAASGVPNAWGVKNMEAAVAEWCLDWHGEYPAAPQVDPIGPADGWAKVIRGGGLDKETAYYVRPSNRAGMPPNFPPTGHAPSGHAEKRISGGASEARGEGQQRSGSYKSEVLYLGFTRSVLNNQGNHHIGFRVVCAANPSARPIVARIAYAQQGVSQSAPGILAGPDATKPYFRKRYLLPTPPENTDPARLKSYRALGWPRGFLRHQHSPGLEVANNGDVIFISFTAVGELDPDVALLITRLRHGADEWDPPDLFLDLPDVDDHAPMLWNDNGTLWFFWGTNRLDSGFPFQWINSDDNGATWSRIKFPNFTTPVGPHSAQPITSAFRDPRGRIYVASDAVGPESVLWQSDDNGSTWRDPGGRSGGRHTAFVLKRDGMTIMGMGGKSSNIEGFMPKSISTDGGRTYTVTKTPFAHLGSNQRPTCIRLASGRLFMAGDYQSEKGAQPVGIDRRGCYVALSDDDGETWLERPLLGTQRHERADRSAQMNGDTLGYAVARQAPNGVIHLIATMTEPCLHFELNEAWILSGDRIMVDDASLRANTATRVSHVGTYEEKDATGRVRMIYSGGMANDGRFLFDGEQRWFYPDGSLQRSASYSLGRLTGREKYFAADGHLEWERIHRSDALVIWTNFWPNGKVRTRSEWRDQRAEGRAVLNDFSGREIFRVDFEHGIPRNMSGDPGEN